MDFLYEKQIVRKMLNVSVVCILLISSIFVFPLFNNIAKASGIQTFLSDDFNDNSLDTSKWTSDVVGSGNSYQETNQEAKFTTYGHGSWSSGHSVLWSKTLTIENWVSINISGKWKFTNPSTAEMRCLLYDSDTDDFVGITYATWTSYAHEHIRYYYDTGDYQEVLRTLPRNYVDFTIVLTNDTMQYWENGAKINEVETTTLADTNSFKLQIGGWDVSSGSQYMYFDDIEVNATIGDDVTPPVITISSPEWEETYYTNTVWLNVSANEDIDTWWYSLDSGVNTTFSPNTTISVSDGSHNLVVYANDTLGNIGSDNVGFAVSVDEVGPSISGISADPSTQYADYYVNIECTVSDDSGVDEVKVNVTDPALISTNTSMSYLGDGIYYYNTTYSTVGVYSYFIWANDTEGNAACSTNYTFTIQNPPDETPPASISNLTHVVDETWVNWTWTNPDDEDFCVVMLYINGSYEDSTNNSYYNKSGLIGGLSYTLSTHTMDNLEHINSTWVNDTATTLDLTPPQLSFLNPSENNSIINISWVNITIQSNENLLNATLWWNGTNYVMNGSYTTWFYNITGQPDGNYSYKVFANDTSENPNNTDVQNILIDTIFPSYSNISQSASSVLTGQSVNVSVYWQDAHLNYAWLQTNQTDDEEQYWRTISIIQLQNPQNWSNFTINLNEEDSGNIVGWKIYANDTAGNINVTPISNIYIVQAPSIISYNPAQSSISNNTGATRTFNITADQTVNITWRINGTLVQTDNYVAFSSYTNNSAIDGLWNVTATITNENGSSSHEWLWTVNPLDSIPPEISNIQETPDPQEQGGYVNIECDVSDNYGITAVKVNVTDPALISTNTSMSYLGDGIYYYNTTYSTVGVYSYFIWANDTSGNSNISSNYTFTIEDTISPILTYVSPTPSNGASLSYSTSSVTISVSSDENVSEWILQWNTVNQTPAVGDTNTTYSVSKSVSSGHSYSFRVYAKDASENTGDAGLRSFSVKSTPSPPAPTVPGKVSGLTATPGDKKVTLSWATPSSGGSSITKYRVYRGLTSGGESSTPIAEPTSTNYVDTGLTNGHTYYYMVSAVNGVGEGQLSNEASATLSSIYNIDTGEAFLTVQAAINDANTQNGHTIEVGPGTYTGSFVVTKQLTIRSTDGAADTILTSSVSDDIIEIQANNVVIDGFTIKGSFGNSGRSGIAAGILLFSNQDCTIENNIFENDANAITFYFSNTQLIQNNVFSNCGGGINYMSGSSGTIIQDNTFSDCTLDALWIEGSQTIIRNNIIKDNHAGLALYSASNNQIYNNYFDNTINYRYSGSIGVNKWNTTKTAGTNIIGGPYIAGNYWSEYTGDDSTGDGIGDTNLPYGPGDYLPLVYFPVLNVNTQESFQSIQKAIDDKDTVDGHTLEVQSGNYDECIAVDKQLVIRAVEADVIVSPKEVKEAAVIIVAHSVTFDGFTIQATPVLKSLKEILEPAKTTGIVIKVDGCNIVNTTISGFTCGVNIENVNFATIQNNYVYEAREGISALQCTNLLIKENTLVYNEEGIFLEKTHESDIIQNTISYTSRAINIKEGYQNLFSENIITENNQGIILTQSSNENIFSNNTIEKTEKQGIQILSESNENTLENNIIISNDNGLLIDTSHANIIFSNIITDNRLGVSVENSFENLIYNNYLRNRQNAYNNADTLWNAEKVAGKNIVNGPYLGGNYWDDYDGTDKDGDELGDKPYKINREGEDEYPLLTFPICNNNTQRHYPTITKALSDTLTQSGHVIIVNQGTYYENIHISFPITITIESNLSLGDVIIQASNPSLPVFHITSDNVIINGFVIRGATSSEQSGVFLDHVEDCYIYNNRMRDNYAGIKVEGSTDNQIKTNFVVDNEIGIMLVDSAGNHILNNFFSNTQNAFSNGNSNNWNVANSAGTNIIGGARLGGNYWSDYTGKDQIISPGDGIGDTNIPYQPTGETFGDVCPLVNTRSAYIHINGNDEFTFVNGVIYGRGTSVDPYGIEGYNINTVSSSPQVPAISIENTDAYFVLRNCKVNAPISLASVYLNNVKNALIENISSVETVYYTSSSTGYNAKYGVMLNASSNNEIKNCNFQAMLSLTDSGIYLLSSLNNKINSNIACNANSGVKLVSSQNNQIQDNTVAQNQYGIYLSSSNDNEITDNTADSNKNYGIYVSSSSGNNILRNSANSNADSAPIYCCDYGAGIYLYSSSYNTIQDNIANSNYHRGAYYNNFGSTGYSCCDPEYSEHSYSKDSGGYGIRLYLSSNNILLNNTINQNGDAGILLQSSNSNNVEDNIATSNVYNGINLLYCSDNILSGNLLSCPEPYSSSTSQEMGIRLDHSNDNTFYDNILLHNLYGIYLSSSTSNLIYNNYFDNYLYSDFVSTDWSTSPPTHIYNYYAYNSYGGTSGNLWNTTKTSGENIIGGPYLGGNYWSDYSGADLNGDKLGDTTYNGDHHPLVDPQTIHIIGNSNFTSSNGVTSGSGTSTNPYILENLDITSLTGHGIWIQDTTAHFIVKNSNVHGGKANLCHGIYLQNVENGRIENIISNNNNYGIYITGSNNIEISGSTVTYNNKGIFVESSSNINFANSTISTNTDGLWLKSSSDNTIQGNTVSSNTNSGILLKNSSSNNEIFENVLQSNANGLYIKDSPSNEITLNQVQSNQYGILVEDSPTTNLDANAISLNNEGVHIESSTGLVITNNTVTSNNDYGLYLFNSPNIVIDSNSITSNDLGLKLETCDDVLISSNDISNNKYSHFIGFSWSWETRGYGLYISSSSPVAITDNVFSANGIAGIYLSSSDASVTNNIIKSNKIGLSLYDTYGTMQGNYIGLNSNDGIQINCPNLAASDVITIKENTISDNNDYGIEYLSLNPTYDITKNRFFRNKISLYFESPNPHTISNNAIYDNQEYDAYVNSGTSLHYIILNSIYTGKTDINISSNVHLGGSPISSAENINWGSDLLNAAIINVESTQFGVSRDVGDLMTVHVIADSYYGFVSERLYLVDTEIGEISELYSNTLLTGHIDKAIVESIWDFNDSTYDLFYEATDAIGNVVVGYVQLTVKNVNLEITNVNSTVAERIYTFRNVAKESQSALDYSDVFADNERGSFIYVTAKNNGIKPGFGRIQITTPSYLKNVTDALVKIIYLEAGEEKTYTFYLQMTKFDYVYGWEPVDPGVFPSNKLLPINIDLQNLPTYTLADSTTSQVSFKLGPIFKIVDDSHQIVIWEKIPELPNRPYDGDGDNVLEAAENHHFSVNFQNIGDEPANIELFMYRELIVCDSTKYEVNLPAYDHIIRSSDFYPTDTFAYADDNYPNYHIPEYWDTPNRLFGTLYPVGTPGKAGYNTTKYISLAYADWWTDAPNLGFYPPADYSGDESIFLSMYYTIPSDDKPYRYISNSINREAVNVKALEKTFTQSSFTMKDGDIEVTVYSVDIENGTVQFKVKNNNEYVFFEYKLDSYYDTSPEGYKWYHCIPPSTKMNVFSEDTLEPNKVIPHMKAIFGVKWSLWANELKLGMMALEAIINIIIAEATGGSISVEFSDQLMGMTGTLLQIMNAYESIDHGVPPTVTINGVTIDGQELADAGLNRAYFSGLASGNVDTDTITTFIDAVWDVDGLKDALGREVLKAIAKNLGLEGLYNVMMEPGDAAEDAFDTFLEQLREYLVSEEGITETQSEQLGAVADAAKTFMDIGEWAYNNVAASGSEQTTINILDPPGTFTTDFEIDQINYFGGAYTSQSNAGDGNVSVSFLENGLVKINGSYILKSEEAPIDCEKIKQMVTTLNGKKQDANMAGSVCIELISQPDEALNASIAFRNPIAQQSLLSPHFEYLEKTSAITEGDRIIIIGEGVLKSTDADMSINGIIIINESAIRAQITKTGYYIIEKDDGKQKLEMLFGSTLGVPLNQTDLLIIVEEGSEFESDLPFEKIGNTYYLSYLPESLSVGYVAPVKSIGADYTFVIIMFAIVLICVIYLFIDKKRF